jgi:hypothetical protein
MGFRGANRGQSMVIGALLIFGIIIALIGILQVTLVPQTVSDVEQNHAEVIDQEFTEIHSAITDAAGSNSQQSASITLGTTYQPIPPLVLPPDPTGTLQITDAPSDGTSGEIVGTPGSEFQDDDLDRGLMGEICGMDEVNTKRIQYRAHYNEFSNAGEPTYETGITYKSHGSAAVASEQNLVIPGDTVTTLNIVPITHGSVRTSGSTAQSLTFVPGMTGRTETFEGDSSNPVEITIPISHPDGWEKTLDGVDTIEYNIDETQNEVTLRLVNGSHNYRIRCTPVGIDTNPENAPGFQFRDQGDAGGSGAFNSIDDGELILETFDSSSLTFWNSAEIPRTVEEVRVPWAAGTGASGGGVSDLTLEYNGSDITPPTGQAAWTEPDTEWTWEGDTTDTMSISYSGKNNAYAVVFRFEDGTTSTYLISDSGGGS